MPQFDKIYYAIASDASVFNHGEVIYYDGDPDNEMFKGMHWFRDIRGKFQLLTKNEFTDNLNDLKK